MRTIGQTSETSISETFGQSPLLKLPTELKQLKQWVVWKYEFRGDKRTKVPFDPTNGHRARTNDPKTWGTYEQAITATNYDGIGFVITAPYVGIDLDKCYDPQTGQAEPWANEIINELDSYTEISPSGRGIHVLVRGTLPKGRRRAGRVEVYSSARYFAMTGHCLPGACNAIKERDLRHFHSMLEVLDPERMVLTTKPAPALPSSKVEDLMRGDWQGLYPTRSEADAALCAMLALKLGCDPTKIDGAFRESGLMRDKWDSKRGAETYGQITVRNAIGFVQRNPAFLPIPSLAGGKALEWRSSFKSYSELEKGDPEFLINGFLPCGINFVAGLPAVGKTWFAISLAKALVSGQRFMGNFDVPTKTPVIYLIPEAGERSFRARLEKMRMDKAGDSFICRTMHSKGVLSLTSPELLEATRVLNPVVILDTMIRFSTSADENSSTENRALAEGLFGLLKAGARGIVALHHSPKASAGENELTLENSLRGTSDIGALCDSAYALRCIDKETLEIRVQCVKSRDFEPHTPFHVMGKPYINERGNFAFLTEARPSRRQLQARELADAIRANPKASYRQLSVLTGIAEGNIKKRATDAGWTKTRDGWVPIAKEHHSSVELISAQDGICSSVHTPLGVNSEQCEWGVLPGIGLVSTTTEMEQSIA